MYLYSALYSEQLNLKWQHIKYFLICFVTLRSKHWMEYNMAKKSGSQLFLFGHV